MYRSLVVVALCVGCGSNPRGDWSGVFTNEEGEVHEVHVEVGDRDRDSLLAYEPYRWRVFEAEGRIDGWFAFEGVFMRCVKGPCVVNILLTQDQMVEKSIEKYPQVPRGGLALVGMLDDELMDRCNVHFWGGRSWPVFAIVEGSGENELTGEAVLGAGCDFRPFPGWEAGELTLWQDDD